MNGFKLHSNWMSRVAQFRCDAMISRASSASRLKSEFDIPALEQDDYLETFIESKRSLLAVFESKAITICDVASAMEVGSTKPYPNAAVITHDYLNSILNTQPLVPKSDTLLYRFQTKLAVFGRLFAAYDGDNRKVTDDELSVSGYAIFGSVLLAYFQEFRDYNALNSVLRVCDIIERDAFSEGASVSSAVPTFFKTLTDVLEEVLDDGQ